MDVKLLNNIVKLQLIDFGMDKISHTINIMIKGVLLDISQELIDGMDSHSTQFGARVYVLIDNGKTRMELGVLEKPSSGTNSMFTYRVNTNTKIRNTQFPPLIKVAQLTKNKRGKYSWVPANVGLNKFLLRIKLKIFIDG